MIVTLDGVPLGERWSTTGTLRELIDEVRHTHLGDRLVVTVTIDGQPLLDQKLGDRLDQPLGDVDYVHLTSANPRQLTAEALREVADRLRKAGEEQAEVADQLNAGDVSEAVVRFGEFLEVWRVCQQSIAESSRVLDQDLTTLEAGGRAVRDHLDALADQLRELRDALEARDMVLLGDLLRYEIPDTCKNWQGILIDLAGSIATDSRTSGAGATNK